MEDVSPPAPQTRQRHSFGFSTLLFIPLLSLLFANFIIQPFKVSGQSMESTLSNGDSLLVNKTPQTLAKLTHTTYIPKRGDIIIFVVHGSTEPQLNQGQDLNLIKRVIGLPGDRVVVKNGAITIYNSTHPEGFDPDAGTHYIETVSRTPGDVDLIVSEGHIFACGDNRTNSTDSRALGPIPVSDVLGTLIYRFPGNHN